MNHERRALRLAEKVASKEGIDCIAIFSSPNLRYFFNYSGESFERFCCGILSKDGARSALVVPRLDRAKAEKSSARNVYPWTDDEGYSGALCSALNEMRVEGRVIGVELGITMGQMDNFKSSRGTSSFVAISQEISDLRLIKDEEEIDSISNTARTLSLAFKLIPELLHSGKKEVEVAMEIKNFLSEKGANSDFCAVQSGKNSAIPHSQAGKKKMEKGEVVVIDVSCTNEYGYFADFTRTFALGKPSPKAKEVYSIVKEAQKNACSKALAGSSAKDIDYAARSNIAKSGYADNFLTRTGHGLGIEVHEPPWIRGDNDQELERGMVFTVEPGIYLHGGFGVRIEDNLIINKRNAVNITNLSHELIEV